MTCGAIDIGTNGARLLIGKVLSEDNKPFINKIHYLRIPLRLGENVFEKGIIDTQKIEKFVETIDIFQKICNFFQVKTIRACATSAMREATNRQNVVEQIYNRTGVTIEVISGQQEAELIFEAFELIDIKHNEPFVVVDVGGGSTEISLFMNGKKQKSKSFEIGTLRLLNNKINNNNFKQIKTWLSQNVDINKHYKFYATGGNINKAHKLLNGKYLNAISYSQLQKLNLNLEKLSTQQRMKLYQIKKDRAEVIVPAIDIYCNIMKLLKCKEVIVPKIGLSDGIIYNLYKQNYTNK